MPDLSTLTADHLLLKRRSLKRQLSEAENLLPLRIAMLGGSTTNEVVDLLELLLLAEGFQPTFYQSEYGRYFEDAALDPSAVVAFRPDLVYLHVSHINLQSFPALQATEAELADSIAQELARHRHMWTSLQAAVACPILQNNYELPPQQLLGNLDAVSAGGRARFVTALNAALAAAVAGETRILLQDVQTLSAQLGLAQWFDQSRWFSYKLLLTPEANLLLARSLTSLARALYGRSRKVLVLDLDNTLWGGVIGDDGVDRIRIGRETPVAEAYTAFQEYCLAMRQRGVLLAVCSKNDDAVAKSGLAHPDSVLRLEHFSAFRANWQPKHENLLSIAQELNLGVDSLVFVDDNPAERAIVQAQLPAVAVPDVGSDVEHYPAILNAGRYFETVALSQEDLQRAGQYAENAQRAAAQSTFATYGDYLDSLEMSAEIDRFQPVYMERIAQLTNKTNQFNLTTRRYTLPELEAAARDPQIIGLYGRLTDRFGDNGLISVVLGHLEGTALHMDLWLMSCRVLKRDMELAMLDTLVEHARAAGATELVGRYIPSKKNSMVTNHYRDLGFTQHNGAAAQDGTTHWSLPLKDYAARTTHIRILETTLA